MRTVRAAKLTPEELAAKAEREAETERLLTSLGLTIGDIVRWQKVAGGKWQQGTVCGTNKDGSLAISSKYGSRSLWPHVLEYKTRGPKGGTVWQAVGHETLTEPGSSTH